ncbi:MAG: hypothetical protein JWQ81_6097 [Amycolatopsis sp.]|uniref:hypothetical protein n=1 Tax=Amycolatopsis sp. TaxID=37632 RepID=UPI002618C499|nr:hypothetical protein [Amycolatopsis sp.]MCU1685358.1 hypothetical protein [Amycolatopsis sp.]
MARTVQPDATAGSATSAELLDRTGIIAASLPQRRRVELGPKPEPVALPVPEVHEVCPKDADLRPREVVIRRRSRGWLAAGAALTLLAVGWVGGGMFGVRQADQSTQADIQHNVAAVRPVAVAPAPAPVAPPVVAVTPEPASVAPKNVVPHHVAAPKSSKQAANQAPAARADVPAPTSTSPRDPMDAFNQQVAALIQPFIPFMQQQSSARTYP